MMALQKCRILEPPPSSSTPMSLLVTFLLYSFLPYVIRQIVTNVFLD